jgi:hypothetical protein
MLEKAIMDNLPAGGDMVWFRLAFGALHCAYRLVRAPVRFLLSWGESCRIGAVTLLGVPSRHMIRGQEIRVDDDRARNQGVDTQTFAQKSDPKARLVPACWCEDDHVRGA